MDGTLPKGVVLLLLLLPLAEESQLLKQLSFVYKDTFVVYGTGRRTERDLPVCEGAQEACSLAHRRPWLRPITERFCRCPRRIQCPLPYEQEDAHNSQHVSNRAQLKFCEELDESFKTCTDGSPAMELQQKAAGGEDQKEDSFLTRTNLFCRCPWPNNFILNKTTQVDHLTKTLVYSCEKLPRCDTWEVCGYVRKDTYELYYTCSCPEDHLCDFTRPLKDAGDTVVTLAIPYYIGESYQNTCTPKNGVKPHP